MALTDISGNVTVIVQYDYTYDGAGNVTAEQSSDPTPPVNLPAAAMAYTSDNRLATYNGQSVEFDADGNMTKGPLGGVMENYAYDSRNRLTSVGNTAYRYDAENNRIGVTENGRQISYIVNPNAPLSQVLIKTDDKGNQAFYVYGLGLIGQEDAGVYHTYHYDRRGSTVALTDISGNVTDRIQYSPYGSLTHRIGNTSTPFLYNGKYVVMADANGLYHMRARYYNPEIRRFVNQDVLMGSINNGQSLNRYAYVNGCPISYVDPFGLSRDGDSQTSPDLLPPAEMWSPEYLKDSQRVAGYVMAGSLAAVTAGLGAELLSAGSSVIPAVREFINKGATNNGSVWKGIRPTQQLIEGTNIPKSFVLNGMKVAEKELWVNPNATKHMAEFVNSAANRTGHASLVEREMMASFQSAVQQAIPQLQPGRNFLTVGGWELGINTETGVIYHALMR